MTGQQLTERPRRKDVLRTSTIREFGGGWNVIDNDLNLSTRFAKVLKNMSREQDGSIGIRYGTRLFARGDEGSITSSPTVLVTFRVTRDSRLIELLYPNHGMTTGDNLTISGANPVAGLRTEALNATHTITRLNDDTLTFRVASTATLNINDLQNIGTTRNTHKIAGTIVNIWYFQDSVYIVDTYGIFCRASSSGVLTRIWDDTISDGLTGAPNAWTKGMRFASAAVFNGQMIVCNGIDKPLLIDKNNNDEVDYLQDLGTSTNFNTPVCRYVTATANYLVMAGDPVNPDRVHISNIDTSGTWEGDTAPNDGTHVDLGSVLPSFDQSVKGVARYRDTVAVMFANSVVIGQLGTYDEADHIPDFTDVIEQHGALSHRSIISLGNDLLMCDDVGVPSLSRTQFTNDIRPNRVSQLIDPAIQDTISRLTTGAIEDDVFAVYNKTKGEYMLFVPRHDGTATVEAEYNGLATVEGSATINCTTRRPHGMEVGDIVEISGATAVGGVSENILNTTHVVTFAPDSYIFRFTVSSPATRNEFAGGSDITITPQRTELSTYVYTSIDALKIKAWSEYRGWNWSCSTRSVLNRIFFGKDRRIYVYGSREDPIYGDFVDEYDSSWSVNTNYVVGDRVYDTTLDKTFICIADHRSSAAGTFEVYRRVNVSHWEEYLGDKIEFDWELPWADFDERVNTKNAKHLGLDTRGEGQFTCEMYVDNIRRNVYGEDDPTLSMDFVGGDAGGFGNAPVTFGGGRNTADERMWVWTSSFKLAKLRFKGATNKALRFVAITLAYTTGSVRKV